MKATSAKKKLTAKAEVKENSFPVVAIGASAGGLEAMMELLKYLPGDTGMAFIYVQHLSPDHKSMLTEILSKKTKMIVQEIDDMDKIKPDNVFVIPYNKGIEVTDGHIKLIPRSESSAAISIDILFSSLAEAQKERVIGIVLSGSASDGTLGIKAIKQHGGLTFAQDNTAKFISMPHSAIATGAVDFILSPKDIALELTRLSKHPLIKIIGVKNGEEDLIENSNPDLKTILNQLHKATGVDFSAYKMNTIKRRIIRRMLLYKITQLKEYAKLLSQKKEEIDILYQDLLINVTSFFRDTDTHKYLKENLLPKLIKRKKTGESLRIWVPACATGEEAYSIAMMLLEIQGSQTTSIPVQIFATDLSQQAIGKARIGIYAKKELETVSPKRIQRFFTKDNGSFRVNKAVRDMCVFAPHNILHDPPFSRLDFISCCNLFIYFDTAAQKKAVNTFHYALNDDGFLMLGKSENISQSANLFTGFNKKYKIFSRKTNSGTRTLPSLSPRFAQQGVPEKNIPIKNKNKIPKNSSVNHNGLDNAIDAVLISEFMPASVVINHQMEIVQFRGTTDLFLTHPKGKATFNILKMARPEIAFELRNAISKVIKTKHRIRKSGIEINPAKSGTDVRSISVEVVPLKIAPTIIGADEPLLLILFTEQEHTEIYSQNNKGGKNNSLAKDRRIKKLELELADAHADALAISQEQEAFTEELQSASEEVVSSNEELQTVNEELETSKEEIESANEELTTTNQELQTRNDLLNESYEYSQAITATIQEAMIVLDKNLRVKSANNSFYRIFGVKEEETEGMFLFDLGNKQWNIPSLREFLQEVVPKNSHFHDFEVSHNFPQIGEKIMLLNASRIIQKRHGEELILLSINDVTEVRKKALELLAAENKYLSRFHNLLQLTPVAIAIYRGSNYIAELVNDLALEILNKDKNLIGKPLFQSMPELESQLKPAFDKVMQSGIPFHANEFEATILRNGKNEKTYFKTIFEPIREDDNTISGVIVVAIEVTDQVLSHKKIEDSEKRYNLMLMKSPFAFAILKGKNMVITLANDSVKEVWGKGKDLEGKPLLEVLPEIKDSEFPGLLDKVYTTGIPFNGKEVLAPILRNGKLEDVYFNFVYQPYLEADETISGVTVIAYEVTEQVIAKRKIEESEQRLRLATQTSGVGIWEWNVITNKIKWDAQMFHIYGVIPTADGFVDYSTWLNAVVTEDRADEERILQDTVRNIGSGKRSFKIIRASDGMLSDIEAIETVRANAEGNAEWVVGTNLDVTEQAIAKRKIEESEQRFRNLIYTSPSAIGILLGEDLVITTANEPIIEIWGKGKKIMGKKYFEALPELAEQGYKEVFNQVYKTGIPFNAIETPVSILQNGVTTLKYYNFILYPQKNINGEINGIGIIATEVTTQAEQNLRIKESEKKFKELAELMPQKVWTADAEGNKNYFNKTLLDYTGMSFEELKGEGWKKIIHPDDWEQDEKKWKESVSTGKKYQSESRFLSKDGKYMWHLTLAVPLKDEQDNIILWIGSKTEIDEQKEAKSKAEAAKLAAEEAMQAKQQFLSNMSHEIRTPLNSILGFTNVLLKTELGIEQKEFVQAIKTSGKSLNVLINDILDLAKVDAGKMTFEIQPFEIRAILKSIIHSFKLKVEEKNLQLVKEYDSKIPLMLLGDSARLNQIIINLISNAIKFTHKGKIVLSVKLLNENKENVTIEFAVTDTGIGIAANKIDSIFKLFEQAKTGIANSYGGTGLGLAIVKQLIEAQGGSISVKSKPGEGSTFSFILPFGKTNIKSEEEIGILKPDPEIKNLRVLVAEDVALNQLLIKIILSDFGFEYEIVSNGKLAIEKLQTNTYDIILMDLQMPEMTGFEATEYIRKTMKSQIPIIALTADVTTVDVSKCKEFGMDDYISKPINENLLYSKIVALVKGKQ